MQQEIWFQKYLILDLLGRGSNAEVYLAKHIKLNSFRAIKRISKNHPLYDIQWKEAFILKNLKHSCIPIIYDIEENEECSCIVEQYIEGVTLRSYISTKGTLHEEDIIRYGLQLCDLIRYLHSIDRPILYVDLKPDNIIVSGKILKLVDFGSAIYLDELSDQQGYYATRGYAAPELYRNKQIDERCDVYGIGMLLYFMATGLTIPKDSSNIENIDHAGKCSKQLKKIMNRCLRYNPIQRYASVAGLSKQLSAMIHKNQFLSKSSQTVKIAAAGAQPRIGVTHLAIRLCNYLIGKGYQCLYQEKNDSNCVWAIKNCYEEIRVHGGIYEVENIPMLAGKQSCKTDTTEYRIVVYDYGCLSQENLTEFLQADIKLLVAGAKDWELEYAEQVIHMTAEYKDIIYLFNYIDGKQFQRVVKSMEHFKCGRIPYEPDPYAKITSKNGLEFFRELTQFLEKVRCKEETEDDPMSVSRWKEVCQKT